MLDRHRAVSGLAHVVDREGGDRTGGHGLHLDAGAVDGLDLGLDLDEVVADGEVDPDGADEHRVAHGDQLGGALRGLDPGDPGRRQHVALGDRVVGHLGRRLGQHRDPAASEGPAVRGLSRRDIDHSGAAQRVEIGQHAVGHGAAVYDLRQA